MYQIPQKSYLKAWPSSVDVDEAVDRGNETKLKISDICVHVVDFDEFPAAILRSNGPDMDPPATQRRPGDHCSW